MLKRMMAEDVQIGDVLFKIRPLGAMKAAHVFGDLVSVVLPILGAASLASGIDKNNFSTPASIENLMNDLDTDSLVSALAKIDGKALERIISELVLDYQNVTFQDDVEWKIMTRDDFDEIFCMWFAGALKLCAAVIKQNFGSFFGDVSDLFGNLLRKAAQKKTSLPMENLTASK